jgi:hypothetical protein
MLAHTKGREENLLAGTQIRSLRMSGPLDGVPDMLAIGHPLCRFIPCFVRSGQRWPGRWVLPSNYELLQAHVNRMAHFGYGYRIPWCSPTSIVWPILDMVTVSHDVAGVSCEELEWCLNMCLLHPFTMPVRAHRFASSVVTPWGYKAGGRPCTILHPLKWTPVASSPPSLRLKRKRGREIDLKIGERVVELTCYCFFLPSFQTMVEQGWTPSEVT